MNANVEEFLHKHSNLIESTSELLYYGEESLNCDDFSRLLWVLSKAHIQFNPNQVYKQFPDKTLIDKKNDSFDIITKFEKEISKYSYHFPKALFSNMTSQFVNDRLYSNLQIDAQDGEIRPNELVIDISFDLDCDPTRVGEYVIDHYICVKTDSRAVCYVLPTDESMAMGCLLKGIAICLNHKYIEKIRDEYIERITRILYENRQ